MHRPDRSLAPAQVRERPAYVRALVLVQRHAGQLDPAGLPKPEHFERVAARLVRLFPGASDAQLQAALLHDVFEPDGGMAREQLLQGGVSAEALRIIERITLPQDESDYLEYSCGLALTGDALALQVKLADNLDAVDLLRAHDSAEARKLLRTRYWPSCAVLLNALGHPLPLFTG